MSERETPRLDAGLEEVLGGAVPPDLADAVQRRVAAGDVVEIAGRSSTARGGWRRTLAAAALVLFAVTTVVATGALQPEDAGDKLLIRCWSTDGGFHSGVLVHVWQRMPDPDGNGTYRQFGPYESDAQGQVVVPKALTYDGEKFDRWVHAYVPGQFVGFARSLSFAHEAGPIDVYLTPSRTVAGKVDLPTRGEAQSAKVHVWTVYTPDGSESQGSPRGMPFDRSPTFLQGALPELFETETDAEGRFELTDVPDAGRLFLVADAPGLAQAQWSNVGIPPGPIPDVVEMRMELEAVVRGNVVDLNGVPVQGAQVRIRVKEGLNPVVIQEWQETRTDAQGRFEVGKLPSGQVEVVAKTAELAMQPKRFFTGGGRVTQSTLVVQGTVEVHGSVLDADFGTPLAGAWVAAVTPDDHVRLGSDKTDDEGRFSFRVPAGAANIYFSSLPKGYEYPDPQVVERLTVDGTPIDALTLRVKAKFEDAEEFVVPPKGTQGDAEKEPGVEKRPGAGKRK